jgi:hypothetical protein
MRQAEPSPIIARIGRVLHQQLEHDVHEPLPKRWVELIHFLNEKEHAAALITKPPAVTSSPRVKAATPRR